MFAIRKKKDNVWFAGYYKANVMNGEDEYLPKYSTDKADALLFDTRVDALMAAPTTREAVNRIFDIVEE